MVNIKIISFIWIKIRKGRDDWLRSRWYEKANCVFGCVFIYKKKKNKVRRCYYPILKKKKKSGKRAFVDILWFFIFIYIYKNYVKLLYLKSFALALVDEFRNFAFTGLLLATGERKAEFWPLWKEGKARRMEKEKKK